MKKAMLLLLAAVTLLGFVACPNPTVDPVDLTSDWKIKGSFDSWAEHNFTMDELDNNILTYKYTGLRNEDYEFVLMNAAGGELKYSTTDNVAVNTPFTMNSGTENASFKATTVEVTVTVDISAPDAPVVTLVTSGAAATPYSAAELAAGLFIKGDMFTIGWTNTAGTFVDNGDGTGTVTFTDLAVNAATARTSGSFGFDSRHGFLKDATIVSPTVEGNSAAAVGLVTTGDNCVITDIPNSDSVYTIVITLNENGVTVAEKYSMVVTLQTLGTTAWVDIAPWADVYIAGNSAEFGSWTAGSFGHATETGVDTDVWTYTFDATVTAEEFKVAPGNAWGGDIGFANILTTGSPIALSSAGGNIAFTAVIGTSYTITVDFTPASYAIDGKPLVTVATP